MSRASRRPVGLAATGLVLLLAACAPEPVSGVVPPSTAYEGVSFIEDVDFGGPEGILLDVCLPAEVAAGTPAVLSVHGGGWRAGDKAQPQWQDACAWLAGEGFVVFQPNYRLAPEHPFPAALEDLRTALDWIGQDAQVERFGHDPERLAAFGDSAGGNLASLLALEDAPSSIPGLRAVVEISAPLDLTREGIDLGGLGEGFQQVQLDYLGCETYDDCPTARAASPMHAIDSGSPPFFIVHSRNDFIPIEQAEEFAARLEDASVPFVFAPIEGDEHALALLDDDLREQISDWLHEQLAA